ncbi:L,D-transpeptidase [Nostocales cyanobacterium LEGE 11386]|nr:L,D-transpeptidase [Nostocales cyanobacterium LEGE 11386]
MKSLINSDWMRHVKILLAGTALSLSVMGTGTSAAWANNQTIKQTIQTLQQSDQRWIQINLSNQRLIAWEGGKPVYAIVISSGKKSTPTRVGTFKIQSKHKSTRMRGRNYDVPNVPHAMFYQGNYGIHGAYWHRKFGTPVSQGCVNVAPNHAKWLFDWASLGTQVVIHKE